MHSFVLFNLPSANIYVYTYIYLWMWIVCTWFRNFPILFPNRGESLQLAVFYKYVTVKSNYYQGKFHLLCCTPRLPLRIPPLHKWHFIPFYTHVYFYLLYFWVALCGLWILYIFMACRNVIFFSFIRYIIAVLAKWNLSAIWENYDQTFYLPHQSARLC